MDTQTLIVLTLIAAAALYVSRSLWPSSPKKPSCSACPQNRNRAEDYV